MLYRGCCQICGINKVDEFGIDISEVHHIRFFADSHNNDSSNLIVLCPDHHRIIHKIILSFDEGAIKPITYEKTQSYRITKSFINDRERMLRFTG